MRLNNLQPLHQQLGKRPLHPIPRREVNIRYLKPIHPVENRQRLPADLAVDLRDARLFREDDGLVVFRAESFFPILVHMSEI